MSLSDVGISYCQPPGVAKYRCGSAMSADATRYAAEKHTTDTVEGGRRRERLR